MSKRRTDGQKRVSGILMALSSLPGAYGIGDLGKEARYAADWMRRAGFTQWSLLPLNPTSHGDSPYQSPSAFAGNINYISPELLAEDGLLGPEEVKEAVSGTEGRVDYGELFVTRPKLLRRAFRHFAEQGGCERADYWKFCRENEDWLGDYAAFMTIKEKMGYLPWQQWPGALAHRKEPEYSRYLEQWKEDTMFWEFTQYLFFSQWMRLKEYVNGRGIGLIGDMPFYVAHDSADVWSHRELFAVSRETGKVTMWAGVPADYFSGRDRNWGNPVYAWESHEAEHYRWFRNRIKVSGAMYDGLRIDHVIAARRYFGIRDGEKTGVWYDGPDLNQNQFTQAVREEAERAGLSVIAEDLGEVPPGLRERMHEIGWPGMRVLQFAFTGAYGPKSNHLPFYHDRDMVVYTGTHDHPTLKTFLEKKTEEELQYMKWWTGKRTRSELRWALIEEAYKSVADQVMIPVQDILGYGEEARLVFTEEPERSWKWRIKSLAEFSEEAALRMKKTAVLTGRYEDAKEMPEGLARNKTVILVTGASGFIGTNLTGRLLKEGYAVIAVDTEKPQISYEGYRRSEIIGTDVCSFDLLTVNGDIGDETLLEEIFQYEIGYVIHLAALSTIQLGAVSYEETMRVNVKGTETLLRAAEKAGGVKGFVYASTDKVYGEMQSQAYTEEMPLHPSVSPYDLSKAQADELVRRWAKERGGHGIVLRFCNIYGKYDRKATRIVPGTMQSLLKKRGCVLRMFRDEEGHIRNFGRDFLYVDDLCGAVCDILKKLDIWNRDETEAMWGEAFNLGTKHCYPMDEMIYKMQMLTGIHVLPQIELSEAGAEVTQQCMDYSRAREVFGFLPGTSLEDGLAAVAEWWKGNL